MPAWRVLSGTTSLALPSFTVMGLPSRLPSRPVTLGASSRSLRRSRSLTSRLESTPVNVTRSPMPSADASRSRPATRSVADDRENGVRMSRRHTCERLQAVFKSLFLDESSDHDDFDPGRVAAADRELAEIDPKPVNHQTIRWGTQHAKTIRESPVRHRGRSVDSAEQPRRRDRIRRAAMRQKSRPSC